MKLLNLLIALTALVLISSGCTKEEDDPVPQTNTSNSNNNSTTDREVYVKCKVDGQEFISKDDDRFNHAKIFGSGNFQTYQLRGGDEETNSILLTFYDFEGKGKYPIDDNDRVTVCQYLSADPLGTYDCNQQLAQAGTVSGVVEITESTDQVVEGTFEFTAVLTTDNSKKVTVTEGEFKLKY